MCKNTDHLSKHLDNYKDASVYENLTGKSGDKWVFAGTLTSSSYETGNFH